MRSIMRLDVHDVPRNLRVIPLRANRVGLAKHLLSQEVKLAATAFLQFHDGQELIQVAPQPQQLLTHVNPLGEHPDFPHNISRLHLCVVFAE